MLDPKETNNIFSTSYSTTTSVNRKQFNTISNNLKSQNTLDMKIVKIQSITKSKLKHHREETNSVTLLNNGENRMTSAKI